MAATVIIGTPLIELIMLAYKANMSVLLHGMHGIGKSDIFKEAATRLGIGHIECDLSLMEPPDLIGMPYTGADQRTHYALPAFWPQDGQGLIVIEELNRCPRYMRSP